MGRNVSAVIALIRRQASRPFMRGIITSSRTRSALPFAMRSTASWPSETTSTSYALARSIEARSSRVMRSSSAITMTGDRGRPDETLEGGWEEGGTCTQDAPLVRAPQFHESLGAAARRRPTSGRAPLQERQVRVPGHVSAESARDRRARESAYACLRIERRRDTPPPDPPLPEKLLPARDR